MICIPLSQKDNNKYAQTLPIILFGSLSPVARRTSFANKSLLTQILILSVIVIRRTKKTKSKEGEKLGEKKMKTKKFKTMTVTMRGS